MRVRDDERGRHMKKCPYCKQEWAIINGRMEIHRHFAERRGMRGVLCSGSEKSTEELDAVPLTESAGSDTVKA
jgi:hypothetical protein